MSTKSQCSLTFAETNDDSFHPANDVWELDARPPDLSRTGVEAQSSTHRVWHDYLAQLGVHAAIMNLSLPPAGSQRHAYLVGFESARHDAPATEQLLALAERIWSRLGSDPILQFDLSNVAHDDTETNLIAHMLHRMGHGVAAQAHHNGVTVRAIYFRKKGLHPPRQHDVSSLKLILPLFAESAAGGVQLALQSQRSAMLEAMFDRVSLSMAVLTADAKPLFMNSAAKAMLEERKWLIRKADGSVSSTNSKQSKKLRESICTAATADAGIVSEHVHRLDSSSGEFRLAYVLSARSRSGDTTMRCALLFVLAPGKMDAPTQLLEALGLLPSEQRFLGHFLKSSSLGNAAMDCGLSEETARTYLKRVRAKLGVHRQMELAGLISGLVLPLHGGGGGTRAIGDGRHDC